MTEDTNKKCLSSIHQAIDLPSVTSEQSEEHIIEAIEIRVGQLLEGDIDLLMSYLYRLDVLEVKIKMLLDNQKHIPAARGLAELIFQRQKNRILTKQQYKQAPIEGWDSW